MLLNILKNHLLFLYIQLVEQTRRDEFNIITDFYVHGKL